MVFRQRIQIVILTAVSLVATTLFAQGPGHGRPGGSRGGGGPGGGSQGGGSQSGGSQGGWGGGISQAWRDRNRPQGPLRPEHGGQRNHSSVNMFFGWGPGFGFAPWVELVPYGGMWNYGWAPYPYYGYGYGYGPTGVFFNPLTNSTEYFLPPVFAPAELNFGPAAANRFLGLPPDVPMAPAPDGAPDAAADVEIDDAGAPTPAEIVSKLRKSNAESIARGQRFVEFGNTLFLAERFHEALQRYKSALEAAPDQADIYLRQGFALIAVNQYRFAAKAFKISLQLDPNCVRNEFRLDDLYGVNQLAKEAHLEALAREALARPADGDLLFLVGVTLLADGESARAQRFFLKAAELGGDEMASLLAPLTGAAPPVEKVPAAAAGRPEKDI